MKKFASKFLAAFLAILCVFSVFMVCAETPIGSQVSAAANGTGNYRITTSAGLNMRSGPGTGYKKVTAIPYNTTVNVTKISGNWGQTSYNGRSGWICLDYAAKISTPSSNNQAPIANGEYFIASALNNSKFIDCADESKSDGANVHLWDAHYGSNQKVKVTNLNNGCYKIEFVHSGKCLDVSGVSYASGANVHQWGYCGGQNQQWIITSAGNGYYYIVAKHSGKYLDVSGAYTSNGTNIQVYNGNRTNAQKFKFIPAFSVSSGGSSFNPVWPCQSAYKITCMYYYKSGAKHSTTYGYKNGMDIAGGGNIVAVESGTVETVANLGSRSYGRYIVIRHDNGTRSLYAHLKSYNVSKGQRVSRGQVIGVMGSSGNSSGTHLHFEMSNCDPFMKYYKDTYRWKIQFEQNVRSNNSRFNSDKSIVNWIDKYYKKSGSLYIAK